MARKKKIRYDRILFVIVVGVVILFGAYKGLQFAAEGVMAFFNPADVKSNESHEPEDNRVTVVIDAGHGGIDGGAKNGTVLEKDITLKIAKAIGPILEEKNIKVVYTRTNDNNLHSDKFADLKMRADMSAQNKASCFVSIHVNDFDKPDPNIKGFEIYTKDNEEKDINDKSKSLANDIGKYIDELKYTKNRGLQSGKNLRVLKLNTVPSVLIETGYIRGNDFSYLKDDSRLEVLGNSIAKGILEYLNKK